MNYFDLIIAIPLLWGAIMGFKKGLILELASLAGLFLGIWGSMRFSGMMGSYLSEWLSISASLISLISFVLTFAIIVITVYLLAKLIDKSLKIVSLGLLIRISGGIFGMLKYALILSVLLYTFEAINNRWEIVEKDKYQSSYSYKAISAANAPIYNWLDELDLDLESEVKLDSP